MPTVQLEAEVSSEQLLKAVGQMSPAELDWFVSRVITIHAERRAPVLDQPEADLLMRINRGLPPDVQARYDELKGRRDAEVLTADEHRELLGLSDEVERLQTERVEAMVGLARLRGTSLTQLMDDLGISPCDAA